MSRHSLLLSILNSFLPPVNFVHQDYLTCAFPFMFSETSYKFAYIISGETEPPSWLQDFTANHGFTVTLLSTNFNGSVGIRSESVNFLVDCSNTEEIESMVILAKSKRLATANAQVTFLVAGECAGNHEMFSEEAIKLAKTLLNPSEIATIFFSSDSIEISWARAFDDTIHTLTGVESACKFAKPAEAYSNQTLRIAVAVQPPYVIPGPTWKGLEPQIVQTFAELFNFDLVFMESPPGQPPRAVLDASGEPSGLLGLLHRMEADIACGGMTHDADRQSVAEILTPHTVEATRWVIPSPPEADNSDSIYKALSILTWILVVSTLVCSAIVIAMFTANDKSKWTNFRSAIVNVLSAQLDQGYRSRSKNGRFRIFVLVYILYSLIVTNAYRSALSTLLTAASKVSWYETMEELMNDGHTLYLMPSGLSGYEEYAVHDAIWRKMLQPNGHKFTDNVAETLSTIAKTRRGAFLTIQYPAIYTIRKSLTTLDNSPKLVLLPEQVMCFFPTAFASPGFPLSHLFVSYVLRLAAAGLTDYWRELLFLEAERSTISEREDGRTSGPPKLSLRHMHGAFIALFMLLSVSTVVFFLELLKYRMDGTLKMKT